MHTLIIILVGEHGIVPHIPQWLTPMTILEIHYIQSASFYDVSVTVAADPKGKPTN